MNKDTRLLWTRAAAIGSIWAAFEIILGTFLHALRLPFAGTTLTFFSVALLTAFARRYPQKGLFWRAALVTALLRSLMPSTFILGPLVGILLEGLIFEWFTRLLGYRFTAFALAGILAMFSAILHKLVSILLIYGTDIWLIIKNLYFALMRSTGWHLSPTALFAAIGAVYVLAGISAAYTGLYLARSAWQTKVPVDTMPRISSRGTDIFSVSARFRYHRTFIILHLAALIFFLTGLELFPFSYMWPAVVLYEIFLIYRYGKGLRKLNKAFFWGQLLLIALLALWLWSDKKEGLQIGLKMMLRAVLLVSILTAVGTELRNPIVRHLLERRGYAPLLSALQSATGTLPSVLAYMGRQKSGWVKPLAVLRRSLQLIDAVIQNINKAHNQRDIFYITGPSGSGKTTRLAQIHQALQAEYGPEKITGFLALARYENGQITGYELHCTGGQVFPLASRDQSFSRNFRVGRFNLDATVFENCTAMLLTALEQATWLLIDEMGPLECEGKGWMPLFETACQMPQLQILITARPKTLDCLRKRFPEYRFREWTENVLDG